MGSVVRDTMKRAIQKASNASEASKRRAIDVAVAHLRGIPTNQSKSNELESIYIHNSKSALGENDAYTTGSSESFLISGTGNGTEGDASLIRQQGIIEQYNLTYDEGIPTTDLAGTPASVI